MMWSYTPNFWAGIAAAMISAGLVLRSWPKRSVQGAVPFIASACFSVIWELAAALQVISAAPGAKIFWYKVQAACVVPGIVTAFWFALEYADLRRWLVRRTKLLLVVPPLLNVLFILGDNTRHWVWTGFTLGGLVHAQRGVVGQIFFAYGLTVSFLSLFVFIGLFFRSPLQRIPVSLCILGQFTVRLTYLLQDSRHSPWPHLDLKIIGLLVTNITYFLALFRFRLFNLLPIARDTLVEQMREGMLVLDPQQHIVDLNPAAQRMLGVEAAKVRGLDVSAVLPVWHGLRETIDSGHPAEVEIARHEGDVARSYAVRGSVLKGRGERLSGHLILLYETTDQKRAHRQIVEQQRALATLRERDRLARELHDGLGQLLGYVKLQAEALRGMLQRGQQSNADTCLAQLAAVAQDAHADVREYIMSARTGLAPDAGFFAALETYIQRFSEHSGVRTSLDIQPGLLDEAFEPMVAAQLLRIVQEALTNVRKHARAGKAAVGLRLRDGCAEVSIEDDGAGFDSGALDSSGGRRFGLRFMKERAEEVGGSFLVSSSPGGGSRITICVPLLKESL